MTRMKYQNGILYLRVERCRILNFLFQIRGVDIFQLSYSSIGIFFSGETFMVKFSYHNITIFQSHISILYVNAIAQYIFYDTLMYLAHCTGWHFWAKLYKGPFLFIALTAGSLFIYPHVYKYMILVSCNSWTWQCTVLIKITFDFRCIFAFNF